MPDQARGVAVLDELVAAEQAGAGALARWIACCQDPVLRGGLRVVCARDEAHARLARARLEALGGRPAASTPPALRVLCEFLAASGSSDRAKLGVLLARFPRETADPLVTLLDAFADDDETQALLRAIRDDDRVSLDWLRAIGHLPPVVPRERLGADECAAVAAFLGALGAALDGAAHVAHVWTEACPAAGLRGGLRAIAARAAAHAAVVEERLAELQGRVERPALRPETLAAALDWYGASDVPDERKLARVCAQAAPAEAIEAFAADLVEDVETREILRLTAAGEAATTTWLAAYRRDGAGLQELAVTTGGP